MTETKRGRDTAINGAMSREIAGARTRLGLTQTEAAERSGIAYGTYRRIEAGTVNIAVDHMLAIAKAFGMHPRQLLDDAMSHAPGSFEDAVSQVRFRPLGDDTSELDDTRG